MFVLVEACPVSSACPAVFCIAAVAPQIPASRDTARSTLDQFKVYDGYCISRRREQSDVTTAKP